MNIIHVGTTCAIFCCIWNMRYFLLLMQQQVNSKSLPSMHDKYGSRRGREPRRIDGRGAARVRARSKQTCAQSANCCLHWEGFARV